MDRTDDRLAVAALPATSRPAWKGHRGFARMLRAIRHSCDGLTAAFRHEASFREEVVIGVPLAALGWWLAPTPVGALLLVGSVVAVLVVELLNSAIETVADAVTTDEHPLVKRAKDMGSAAVMLALCTAAATWATVLWVR